MSDDLAASYTDVFDGRLRPGTSPALLIVDVVRAYVDPAASLYAGPDEVLAVNRRLAAAARQARRPVIFTNVVYDRDGLNGGLFYRKVPALKSFVEGSALGDFVEELQPEPGDMVVSKRYPSAFFGTDLATTLHVMGVDTVLITGFSTSGCVRASALDALCHGFVPMVVRQGCGDRHVGPHEANLFDLQAKYAEVIDEADGLALLRG
nr:isochorismatase family protein [Sphingomonas sp. Y57]